MGGKTECCFQNVCYSALLELSEYFAFIVVAVAVIHCANYLGKDEADNKQAVSKDINYAQVDTIHVGPNGTWGFMPFSPAFHTKAGYQAVTYPAM